MKKLLVWVCVLALTAALFAGCAKNNPSDAAPSLPVLIDDPSALPEPGESDAVSAPAVPETADAETTEPLSETEAPDPVTTEPVPETEAPAPETAEPVPDTEAPAPETETADVPVEIDPDVHPMLFRVTGANGQEMYLFGTIHVGDERTADAMNLVTPWLDECGALAVEFNIAAYERDMTAQTRDMMTFLLSDGTTIEDHLDPELYEKASELLGKAGLFPAMMKSFDTAMWSQLVEQAALITTCADLDFNGGMDRQLIARCEDRGVEVRDVESAELQYGLMASFPEELNVLMIRETLNNLDSYADSTHALYEAWLSGDYDRILDLVESDDETDNGDYTAEELAMVEDYNYRMLDQRNLGMRNKAVQWLEAGDKVFFAVGAAHLVGDAGLVNLLRQLGYTVEQITGTPSASPVRSASDGELSLVGTWRGKVDLSKVLSAKIEAGQSTVSQKMLPMYEGCSFDMLFAFDRNGTLRITIDQASMDHMEDQLIENIRTKLPRLMNMTEEQFRQELQASNMTWDDYEALLRQQFEDSMAASFPSPAVIEASYSLDGSRIYLSEVGAPVNRGRYLAFVGSGDVILLTESVGGDASDFNSFYAYLPWDLTRDE